MFARSRSFAQGAERARAVIFSLSGLTLSAEEKAFFKDTNPLGFILFARNCDNPAQLRALNNDLKDTLGRDCPIMIDQEGGRVARLKPPHWRAYPPLREFGEKARLDLDGALEDLRFRTLRIAEELLDCGINVNCDPVLDVSMPETHEVIGDRAFSDDPDLVGRLGVSVCRHYLAAGVTPVIKHIPGHGRATADSHHDLPSVSVSCGELEECDFKPFRQVAASDAGQAVWGMTAHIVYTALDAAHAASASRCVVEDIIRRDIGFDGFLVSDDLGMEALKAYGDMAQRGLVTLEAGCDAALYCAGKLEDMKKIAKSVPELSPNALERLQKAENFPRIAA